MRHLKFALWVIVAAFASSWQASAQATQPLPKDAAVKMGTLPNGLTYYVRKNSLPEKQAFFYIVQKVGSVQENESQRGLAHFLEHMCFNGTTNFPGNGVIEACERFGVKFGENINAYTSTDETVYNIDNVPATAENIETCLKILHDWSNSLLLEPDEIQKERGVIHEEWRMRSSAQQRILNNNLEKLYPGSRYGRRMPIGLMSVVDNFTPDTLRAYYHKWYRPDLQAVVVVGDIDADQIVAKIKEIFSPIQNPKNEAKYEDYPVPSTMKPIYVIDKDKEQGQAVIQAMFKHDPMPKEYRNTAAYLITEGLTEIMTSALNARLNELSQSPDCPFVGAYVNDGNYLMSKTMNAFTLIVVPKPGKDTEAFRVAFEELQRARQFGLTATEIDRAYNEMVSQFERIYNNRDKQRSPYFIQQYVRNFLDGTPMMSIEDSYNFMKMVGQQLKQAGALTEGCNSILKEYTASTDSNFVVLAMCPDKAGIAVPTEAQLADAVKAALSAKLTAYVDNVKNEPLIAKLPKKGKIVKTEKSDFGYTCWTLSNGAKVYYRQTDFNESQVLMQARSFGGLSYAKVNSKADLFNVRNASTFIEQCGLGSFSATELDKALAGKQASVSAYIDRESEGLDGNATPKDLRTLFELTYLKFTNPGSDRKAFNNAVESMKTQLANVEAVPEMAFSDSVSSTIYNHDPRVKIYKSADYDMANFDRMRAFYRERFKSPSDFNFYFTGNFNVDSLKQFAEIYLASIPSAGKREVLKDYGLHKATGIVDNRFTRAMETPKGNIIQVIWGENPYSMKESATVDALGEVLTQRYLKSIREEGSMAYSVGAQGEASYGSKEEYLIYVSCPVKPAKADSALYLIDLGLKEVAKDGCTKEELDKIKQFNLKNYADNQKVNSYWASLIRSKTLWNKDLHTGYEAVINGLSSDDLKNFVNNVVLKKLNRLTITMLPASLKE
ncbi:insulinase family protein [Alloprevotella tannerae]|uniref:M16 family metallopeptidase n=1 Tax=Alloprevotella tannerae TaxID=76122 RepID=UPI0028E652D4|nr:insulinase family protein [Alloprevotella tannerae]